MKWLVRRYLYFACMRSQIMREEYGIYNRILQLYSAQYTSLSGLRDQKIERVSELLGEPFRKLVSRTLNRRI